MNHMDFQIELLLVEVKDGEIEHEVSIGTSRSDGENNDLNITEGDLLSQFTSVSVMRVRVEEQKPFVFRDPNHHSGFNGYCIELLDEISKIEGFKYKVKLATDNKAGVADTNGTWNGLIGDLINNKADLGLPLYVSARREKQIDFTVPIYDLVGLSIMMKTFPEPVNLFKFITVFEGEVWFCMMAVYFIASFFMWIFTTFNPSKNKNPGTRIVVNGMKRRIRRKERFSSFSECLWFCITSLTPQGGGHISENLSVQFLAAIWYIFGFTIISSYTANLAAFLTISRAKDSIESLIDLSKQYKIQYAPINGSLAMEYFQNMAFIEQQLFEKFKDISLNESLSDVERAKLAVWEYPLDNFYTKMWKNMQENGFPNSLDKAISRVEHSRSPTEGFAFIGDAIDIKYAVRTNCDLKMVGEEFSIKPLAIAVQDGSMLRKCLDETILRLLKQGIIQKLKDKWWNEKIEKANCPVQEDNTDGMSVRTMGGVFLLLFAGIAFGSITLGLDYVYLKWKSRRVQNRKTNILNIQSKMKNSPPPPYDRYLP